MEIVIERREENVSHHHQFICLVSPLRSLCTSLARAFRLSPIKHTTLFFNDARGAVCYGMIVFDGNTHTKILYKGKSIRHFVQFEIDFLGSDTRREQN
jgi:hypothetical protein